jgi:transcriptional regulator with XRE-family HTH domain
LIEKLNNKLYSLHEVINMNQAKAGKLIQKLRKEKNMTQLELANRLLISDKAISKWERGLGSPDISLIGELSYILGVEIEKLLKGDLDKNKKDSGNLRKIKFYVCGDCGAVLYSTGNPDISCCGRILQPLQVQDIDDVLEIKIEEIENDYYITLNHPMKKDHYISFIAYVNYQQVLLTKLYPEQSSEVRIPRLPKGQIYAYCSKDGLFVI